MSLLLSLRDRTARADGASEAPPRHVEITVVSQGEDRALEASVSELLERLQVSMRFSTVADIDGEEIWRSHEGAPSAVARAWIDLREAGQVTIYLTGDKQDRVLVRQVPLVPRFDEVAREEVAHIVEAAVDELLLGGQIGVEKKHPAEPRRVDLPAPPPEPPLRLDIGFGYSTQGFSKENPPLHGPAAFVGLAKSTGSWRPGAWLSGEQRFPQDIDGNPVSLHLEQGAVRLLFTEDKSLSQRWTLRGGIGGGIDWVYVRSLDGRSGVPMANADLSLQPSQLNIAPMLRAIAVGTYAFSSKSEIFLGLAADVDIFNTRYFYQQENDKRIVLHPSTVRPTALIGIAVDVLAY